MQSVVDYILSEDVMSWKQYGIIDTNFESYHRLVVGGRGGKTQRTKSV